LPDGAEENCVFHLAVAEGVCPVVFPQSEAALDKERWPRSRLCHQTPIKVKLKGQEMLIFISRAN
jgi:hypothetical protein